MDNEAMRWARASFKAGDLLSKWYWKYSVALKVIAPRLPEIIDTLKSSNIDKIEDLLRQVDK